MMEIISDKKVKIRKSHRCFACDRKFESGTIMRSQTNKYDSIATVYSCPVCDELMGTFSSWFIDEVENFYPQYCVLEVSRDFKIDTPEDLLIYLKSKK